MLVWVFPDFQQSVWIHRSVLYFGYCDIFQHVSMLHSVDFLLILFYKSCLCALFSSEKKLSKSTDVWLPHSDLRSVPTGTCGLGEIWNGKMDMAAALHPSCSILRFMYQGVNRLHMRSCDVLILKHIFLPFRVINTLVLQVLVGHSLTVHLARVQSLS